MHVIIVFRDRFIVTFAVINRRANSTTQTRNPQSTTGVTISTQSVRDKLYAAGLSARRLAMRVPLLRRHCQHMNWTRQYWSTVTVRLQDLVFLLIEATHECNHRESLDKFWIPL